MTKCPHCNASVNLARFSVYSTIVPYRCSKCGKTSQFDKRTMIAIGGFGGMAGAVLASVFHFTLLSGLVTGVSLTLAVMAGMVIFLRLQPTQ